MSQAPELPGFTFVQHVGSGGFADVYLYEQEFPRQRVAVKVVRPEVTLTERDKQLFTAEANAMARLADHPFIVSVITAGVTDHGLPYLVMRYCPPPDLGVRVRTAPLSAAEAISTGIKIASAVETAHRSGIVHRDIKPGNVLMTTYHEPALSDFGIAGHVHEVAGEQEVRISYPWSPPEVLDGRSNGSVASDVYSLGATLWNLLVGRSPFSVPGGDNTAQAVTARILHSPPPPTHRRDVPPALERLLQQCLAKEPMHRPQSALELARALQRIETEAGFSRTPIAVEGDRPGTAPGPAGVADPDATAVKPMTVIPASGPRAAQVAASRARATPSPPPETHGGGTVVWAVLGVVVLAAAATYLALRGGGGDHVPDTTPTAAVSTPGPLAPPSLRKPRLRADRDGGQVTFRWSYRGDSRPDDTWEWRRTDTGEQGRTTDNRLRVNGSGRVCLQVTLVREGTSSPVANRCVDPR